MNHCISDIKVCAISPISCGNDSRKRHQKRLIFKIGTIHPHGLNERFSFIWSLIHCFCFCLACADKSSDFSPFHSIVYVHPPPTYSLCASASFTDRLKNSKWLTHFCILLCICYCFSQLIGLFSVTWSFLLYKFTRFILFFYFVSLWRSAYARNVHCAHEQVKVRTHEATNRGDISPVENTPGDKWRGHTFVTATCHMNSNHLESMRHVAGTKFCPRDKISHCAYDGICPCHMSPWFVASCVLTLKLPRNLSKKIGRVCAALYSAGFTLSVRHSICKYNTAWHSFSTDTVRMFYWLCFYFSKLDLLVWFHILFHCDKVFVAQNNGFPPFNPVSIRMY